MIFPNALCGFPGGSDDKETTCNAGDPEGGHGNPLQYSCLENPKDRGAWWAIVHGGRKESDTIEHSRA